MTASQQNPSSIPAGNPANGAINAAAPVNGGPVARHPGVGGGSMEEILANMMANVPDPSQIVVAPTVAPNPPAPQAPTPEVTQVNDDFVPEIPAEEEVVQTQQTVSDDELLVDDPTEKNAGVRNLRTVYKTVKQEKEELAARLAAVEAERDEYKAGKKLPEVLQDQESEIARLRPLEKIHNLRGSEEYQQKLAPLKEYDDRLKSIFTEYDTPEEHVGEELRDLRNLKTEKQVNEFLEERLSPVAAIEVKEILRKEQALHREVKELEANAEQGLSKLRSQAESVRLIKKKEEREKVQGWIRESWNEVNAELKTDGRFHGLVHQHGRTEWNKTVVTPTLKKAAAESGKIIKSILDEGMTPANVKAIQKMSMLAIHAGLTAEQLNASLDHIQQTEQTTLRDNNIFRPRIGGNATPSAAQKPRERMTAEQMADQSLAGIQNRK